MGSFLEIINYTCKLPKLITIHKIAAKMHKAFFCNKTQNALITKRSAMTKMA